MAADPNPIVIDITDTIGTLRKKINTLSTNVGGVGSINDQGDGDYSSITDAVNTLIERTKPSTIRDMVEVVGTGSSHTELSYNPLTGVFSFVSNDIQVTDIPNLPASKITSGVLSPALIPNIDAGKITGTLVSSQLPIVLADIVDAAQQGGGGQYNTDQILEGTGNLYYTDARARAALSITPNNGLSYDNTTGLLEIDLSTLSIPVALNAANEGTGVSITNNAISIGQAVETTSDVTFNSVTTNQITTTGLVNDHSSTLFAEDSDVAQLTSDNLIVTPATLVQGLNAFSNTLYSVVEYEVTTLANAGVYYLLYDYTQSGNNPYAADGRSGTPDFYQIELVCKTSDQSYTVGDVIPAPTVEPTRHTSLSYGVGAVLTAVAPNVVTGNSSAMAITIGANGIGTAPIKETGVHADLDATKWSLKVRMIQFNTTNETVGAVSNATSRTY